MEYKQFKDIIKKNNLKAQRKGYENYHKFKAFEFGIPDESYKNAFTEDMQKKVINLSKESLPEKYRGKLPISEGGYPLWRNIFKKLEMFFFKEIYDLVGEKSYEKRIKVEGERTPGAFYSEWDNKTKTATIFVPNIEGGIKKFDVQDASYIAHEIGHAVFYIKCIDKGKDISKISKYDRELEAVTAQRKFKVRINSKYKGLLALTEVWEYALALFEKRIYEDPESDFGKIYAEIINRYFFTDLKTNYKFLNEEILTQGECNFLVYAAIYFTLATKKLI